MSKFLAHTHSISGGKWDIWLISPSDCEVDYIIDQLYPICPRSPGWCCIGTNATVVVGELALALDDLAVKFDDVCVLAESLETGKRHEVEDTDIGTKLVGSTVNADDEIAAFSIVVRALAKLGCAIFQCCIKLDIGVGCCHEFEDSEG